MLGYILAAAVLPAIILGYPIFPCDDGLPSPLEMRIDGCDSSPCNVTRGSVIPFEIDFLANEHSPSMTMRAEFTALGETHEFPIPPPLANVCNWLIAGSCPTTPGQPMTQRAAMPIILDFSGGVPAVARMRIYNGSGSAIVCSIINVRIY